MNEWTRTEILTMIAACLIGVISVARTARLVIFDDSPPVEWLRLRVMARLGDKWGKLLTCPFCLAPYLAAGMLAWAWLSWDHPTAMTVWWVANGWWAAAYLAAMIVAYDEPAE